MAAGQGDLCYGIALEYSADGAAWTELEDIDEMSEPGDPEPAEVDVTPLRDTATDARRYRLGLTKGGEFTFSQFFTSARQAVLETIKALGLAGTDYYWRVSPPDAATVANCSHFTFRGPLKKARLKGTGDADDPLVSMCSVTVNSNVVFTPKV